MAIGGYRHVVTFQSPATVPDGDGGFIETWVDLDPPWHVEIIPATIRDLERRTAGTIVATLTHVVAGRYRPDVTVDVRMMFKGRTFSIAGVKNVDERGIYAEWFAIERL